MQAQQLLEFGDVEGHLFHGNQYTGGISEFNASHVEPVGFLASGKEDFLFAQGKPPPADKDFQRITANPMRGAKIAGDYNALPTDDPTAHAAYRALGREVDEQYDYLTKELGVNVVFTTTDPYKNVEDLRKDLDENNRLQVLKTDVTGPHPFFSNEQNDRFRAVHDAFGHASIGRGFDRNGEEAAFQSHAQMFSPEATRALATETRGQNSVLVFGGTGEFPPQKVALLPLEDTVIAALLAMTQEDSDADNKFELGGTHHASLGRWFPTVQASSALEFGDVVGHEFHGNQWTGGRGGDTYLVRDPEHVVMMDPSPKVMEAESKSALAAARAWKRDRTDDEEDRYDPLDLAVSNWQATYEGSREIQQAADALLGHENGSYDGRSAAHAVELLNAMAGPAEPSAYALDTPGRDTVPNGDLWRGVNDPDRAIRDTFQEAFDSGGTVSWSMASFVNGNGSAVSGDAQSTALGYATPDDEQGTEYGPRNPADALLITNDGPATGLDMADGFEMIVGGTFRVTNIDSTPVVEGDVTVVHVQQVDNVHPPTLTASAEPSKYIGWRDGSYSTRRHRTTASAEFGDLPGHEFHGNQYTDPYGKFGPETMKDFKDWAATHPPGTVYRSLSPAEIEHAQKTGVFGSPDLPPRKGEGVSVPITGLWTSQMAKTEYFDKGEVVVAFRTERGDTLKGGAPGDFRLKPLPVDRMIDTWVPPANVTAAGNEDHSDSAMIALRFSPEETKRLKLNGGEDASRLHATLVYLGKTEDVDTEKVKDIVRAVAARFSPFVAHVSGYALFQHDDGDCLVALLDAPELEQLQQRLHDELATVGIEIPDTHGFTAHITLKYLEDSDAVESSWFKRPVFDIKVDSVQADLGTEQTDFPLATEVKLSGGLCAPLPSPPNHGLPTTGPKSDEHPSTQEQIRRQRKKDGKLPGYYGEDNRQDFGDVEGHVFHGNQWTGPLGERLDPLVRTGKREGEALDIETISMGSFPKEIQDKIMNTVRNKVADPELIRANLEKYMQVAWNDPKLREDGMTWYQERHDYAAKLSEETGIPPENIAAALAAMSSGTLWETEEPVLQFMAEHVDKSLELTDEKLDLVNGKLDAYEVVDRAHEVAAELKDKDSDTYASFASEFPNGDGIKEAWAELHPDGYDDKSLNRPDQTLYGEIIALREDAQGLIPEASHIENGMRFGDLDSKTAVLAMQAQFMQEPPVADGGTRTAGWGAGHGWDGFIKGYDVLKPDASGNYAQIEDVLVGPKIRSFVNNIDNPDDPRDVTVDVHMVSAAADDPSIVNDSGVMGTPRYQTASVGSYPFIADQIKEIAAEPQYNVLPQQAQALMWIGYLETQRG